MSIDAVISGAARWCVVHADCLDVLARIERVDHVITDPPYELEAHTKQARIKSNGTVAVEPLDFAPMTEDVRQQVGLHIARIASMWSLVFCQVEAAMLWRDVLEDGGAVYRRTCVWVKPDAMPQLTGDRPAMGYESIVCCHRAGRSSWNGGGRSGVFLFNKNENGSRPNPHPTTKPAALMMELVSLFTDPGDVILDPFCGSGTTGVAALRLGRRFIGIEREERWADLSRERLAAEENATTLHDARAGQLPMFPETH